MSTEEYIALVYRNLKSDLSPQEFKQLNDLTAADRAMSNLRLEIEDAWDATGELPERVSASDTENLLARIKKEESVVIEDKPIIAEVKPFNLRRIIGNVAAIFIIVMGAIWLMRDQVTVYDTAGQYTLSDNSTIDLRKGSRVEVSPFDDTSRKIKLSGEAYFEVAKDVTRPFVVFTKDTRTEVLGTSFLIKESNNKTYIDLKTGKVKFSNTNDESSMILTPGMKAVYADSQVIETTQFQNLSGWKDGVYQYKDAKLSTVLDELNEIFNTEILATDPLLYDCTISAILTGDNINDVLNQIANQLDMKVSGDDSKWTLTGGKCK